MLKDFNTTEQIDVQNNPVSYEDDFIFHCNNIKKLLKHLEDYRQLLVFKLDDLSLKGILGIKAGEDLSEDAFAIDEENKERFKEISDMMLGSIEQLERIYKIIGNNMPKDFNTTEQVDVREIEESIEDDFINLCNFLKELVEHFEEHRQSIIFGIPVKNIMDIDKESKDTFKRVSDMILGSIERLEKIYEIIGKLIKKE